VRHVDIDDGHGQQDDNSAKAVGGALTFELPTHRVLGTFKFNVSGYVTPRLTRSGRARGAYDRLSTADEGQTQASTVGVNVWPITPVRSSNGLGFQDVEPTRSLRRFGRIASRISLGAIGGMTVQDLPSDLNICG
jgi:hypothetical protein